MKSFVFSGPSAQPKSAKKICDCGMRLTHDDILNLIRGTIFRCGYCDSLIWYDFTFWPDMENTYIRWSKMDGAEPLKVSVWMLKRLLLEDPSVETNRNQNQAGG